jgi:DNA-binding CsgD family transcriptional regulator
MMNAISLTLYILSAISVIVTLYVCYLLYRRFQLLYLLNYLYFISAFFVAGFIDIVGRHLAAVLLSSQETHPVMLLNHIFVFLVFPFIPLAIYFFISFMTGFLAKKLHSYFRYIYGAFWVLFFLVLVLTTKNFLNSQDARVSEVVFFVLDNISYVLYLIILVLGFFLSRNLEDGNRKRAVRIFSLVCLSGFVISWGLSKRWSDYAFNAHPLHIFLYFSLNLPSLFYLRYYLGRFQPALDSVPIMQDTDLEGFYEKFDLSRREREIVRLMLTGKSNKEIAGELFVSTHTVKNHVYNIYQKLQVSNRLHFIRIIQSHIQGNTDRG